MPFKSISCRVLVELSLSLLLLLLLLLVQVSCAFVPANRGLPLQHANSITCTKLHSTTLKANENQRAADTETQTRGSPGGTGTGTGTGKIPKDLVDSLDLYPLVQNVAKHAGTKRARDALMAIVDHRVSVSEKKTLFNANYNNSKRNAMLSSMAGASSFSGSNNGSNTSTRSTSSTSTSHIVKVAGDISDAHTEWELITEATRLLKGRESNRPSDKKKSSLPLPLPLPPIYGADASASPWSMNHNDVDTDDDEWLQSVLAGYRGSLELEQILQADMVVKRIVGSYEWAKNENIVARAPNLAEIFRGVDIDLLKEVQNDISGTVVIARGVKSINDPSGTKSFTFQLKESKFPNLSILKNKEKALTEEINTVMQGLFSNKKYVSQLSGLSRRKPEPYELDGRIVVTASREVAQRIGVIRGHASNGSFSYVEPNEVVKLGNALMSIKEEISAQTLIISDHMSATILRSGGGIHQGLDAVARLDTIFARAAFGYTLNGFIPHIGNDGVIDVDNFVHPVLATKGGGGRGAGRGTVPIDLKMSCESSERSLIISGPNGGGKSLAMKSFGLAAMMVKLGIPIPRDDFSSRRNAADPTRVDFFTDILVEVGDHQSLMAGESTYQAHLKSMARLLDRVCPSDQIDDDYNPSSLILIDELGGGTDPTAGACIAQAILEKILENERMRTIVTTHSTQLKALSIDDKRFNSASVLLQVGDSDGSRFRLPTFKLCYGAVGNSYALGAASRCDPPIPEDVLDRAADLIGSSQDRSGEYMRTITEALEREKETLALATEATDGYRNDIIRCRDAIVALARSYDQNFSRIESRLDDILLVLKEDETRNAYDIVGDSLSTLRIKKKEIKSKDEMLREKGMRVVTISDVVHAGDQIMIIAKGDFEGETSTVSNDQNDAAFDELVVDLDFDNGLSLRESKLSVKLKRSELAVWDYPSFDEDWGISNSEQGQTRSVSDSRNRLLNVLSALNTERPTVSKGTDKTKKSENTHTSSRQRKAANKKKKKK